MRRNEQGWKLPKVDMLTGHGPPEKQTVCDGLRLELVASFGCCFPSCMPEWLVQTALRSFPQKENKKQEEGWLAFKS
jgi:hypothetical protein